MPRASSFLFMSSLAWRVLITQSFLREVRVFALLQLMIQGNDLIEALSTKAQVCISKLGMLGRLLQQTCMC